MDTKILDEIPSEDYKDKAKKSGTTARGIEEAVIVAWSEYVLNMKDGRLATIDDSSVWIDLSKLLLFVLGASEIPPAGLQNRPEICFDQDCDDRLPHSSTCGPTLYLPVSLTDITTVQHKIDCAICCGQGFGTS
ncbi:hypothetical protein EMCRGX_G000324 [Ephydatia muelleri]